MTLKIITNHKPRPIQYTDKPDWSNEVEASFLYQGHRYFLSEFIRLDYPKPAEPGPLQRAGYHAGLGLTYFSGIVIKLSDDGDAVTVARYHE